MRKITPAIALSALLITLQAQVVTTPTTTSLTNQTLNDIIVRGTTYTVNSSGTNTITQMVMLGNATTDFNINGGSLALDLSVLNSSNAQNNTTFSVNNNGSLTLTNGANTGQTGVFLGSNTTLNATLAQGTTLNGHLSNNANTTLTFNSNSTMNGNITQSGGTLKATLEGNLNGSVTFANTNASLWAYQTANPTQGASTITGSIIQTNGTLEGILKGTTLQGNFTQTGGTSDIAFHKGNFQKAITISSQATTKIHLYQSTIQDILAQNSTTEFNLQYSIDKTGNGSTMQSFTGNGGNNTITLIGQSAIQSLVSQTGGTLTLSAENSSTKNIVGNGSATLGITLKQTSTIDGSIIGNGTQSTTISSSNSTITGNISQNDGSFQATLNQTQLNGNFTQVGGTLQSFSASNSTIGQGISLSGIATNGGTQLLLSQTTITRSGITIKNAIGGVNGQITNSSIVNGGYDQTNRSPVSLLFNGSTLNNGVKVRNGGGINGNISTSTSHATALDFQNGSTLSGGVISNNHSLWLNFENSTANNGDFDISGGDFYLKGISSTITGNLHSQNTGETRMYLSGANFQGDIEQNGGKQHISMINKSSIIGSIRNLGTESVFANDTESQLKGNYTQDNGTLNMLLGGDSVITGDVTLNNVTTTLGNGTANTQAEKIQGSFTQNGGVLKGNITGLTLEGKFTQEGGTSDITFNSADFKEEIAINNADLSNILFDTSSKLKTTTLTGSSNPDNTFTLNHTTILEGDFILHSSKVTLGVKNGSKITGNVTSTDADSDLNFDFEGEGNEIGGNVTVSDGNTGGTINGTIIGGDFILTDATSHFHITNSTIRGEISITRGSTMMTLDNTSVGKGFTMNGLDATGNHPTLKLRIGNGSSIAGDLSFIDTEAFLGGFGTGNRIGGNLIMTNSIVTNGGANYAGGSGDPDTIPSMSIAGSIKQTGGTSDLSFTQTSSIAGDIQIQDADKAHLSFADTSSIHAINVTNSKDTLVSISNQSTQEGTINFSGSTATLQANSQSSITGDIKSTTTPPNISDTTILLDNSTLRGNIDQDNGNLSLQYSNGSTMNGFITTKNLQSLQISLNNSNITGNMTLTKTSTQITMQAGSSIVGDLSLTGNPTFTLDADNSTLNGLIVHTGTSNNGYENTLNFSNNSSLESASITINGNMKITANSSQINVQDINLILGKFSLMLSNATGTIGRVFTAGSNSIYILADRSTNFTLTALNVEDSAKLTLIAQDSSIFTSNLILDENSTSAISSLSNANLKININPSTQASIAISLNGGMMQGVINQTNPIVGNMTLGTSGKYGGRWIVTGNSAIAGLSISNSSANITNRAMMQANTFDTTISLVDTTKNSDDTSRVGLSMITAGTPTDTQTLARTIRIGKLSGINGVFRVYTDIGAETSDVISASNASGNHIIQAYYNPATFTNEIGNKYIVLAHVDDPQTTASFQGGEVDMGNQTYQTDLIRVVAKDGNGFDWILGSTQNMGASYGTKIISSILQSQYRSYAIQTESLRQRMGELRDIDRIHGLWGRYSMGSNFTPESDVGVEITDNYYTAWVGYDQNVLDLKGQDFYGVALSYSLVAPTGEDYQGQIHNFGINLYNTFIARNDFYVDFVLKYILTYADYQIDYYSLAKNKPSYFNHKIMLTGEIGKKFKLNDSKSYFFLQPDAQITAGYIFGNDVTFVDASQTTIEAHLSGDAPVILRTGLTAGYSLNNKSMKADFYIGSSIFYETSTGGGVSLDDGNSTLSYAHKGDFKMSVQGGLDLIFNDNARVYFEAGTSFMGTTKTTYSINAGARFAFGYKNTRKLKAPPLTPPPQPPKPEYDPRNIPVITDYTTEDIRVNNSATPKTPQGYDSDYFINTRKFYRDKSSVTNNPKPKY